MIESPVSYKKGKQLFEIDRKNFKVCESKECSEWRWRLMREKKFLVHRTADGWELKDFESTTRKGRLKKR